MSFEHCLSLHHLNDKLPVQDMREEARHYVDTEGVSMPEALERVVTEHLENARADEQHILNTVAEAYDKRGGKSAGERMRSRVQAENPFLAFLGQHGVHLDERSDTGGEAARPAMIPGYGALYRKSGARMDELAQRAHEAGFLSDQDMRDDTDNGGTRKLADLIERAAHRKEVIQPAAQTEPAASGRDDELFAEAEKLGIDTTGKSADQVYDEVVAAHAAEFNNDEARALVEAAQDADIDLDAGTPSNLESDEELDAIFGPQSRRAEAGGGETEKGATEAAPGRAGETGQADQDADDGVTERKDDPYTRDIFGGQDLFDDVDVRPGTLDAQKQTARAAVADLARRLGIDRINRRNHADGGKVSVLGSRLLANFLAGKPNQLVGQVAKTPADLAVLAQVYRDPRFETFRVFYTDRAGKIVGEAGYTSRLAASVSLPQDLLQQVTDDKARFGADGYYLLHNHPSGKSEPSQADISMTRFVDKHVPGFQGHVVIDHNEYSVIHNWGEETIQAPHLNGTDFTGMPEMRHAMLGVKITSPDAVARAAKALQVPDGHSTLILTTARGETQLLVDVPMGALEKMKTGDDITKVKALVRRMTREAGAGGNRFMVLPAGVNLDQVPFLRLLGHGVVTDVVSADGKSLQGEGFAYHGDFIGKTRAKSQRVAELAPRRTLSGNMAVQRAYYEGRDTILNKNDRPEVSRLDAESNLTDEEFDQAQSSWQNSVGVPLNDSDAAKVIKRVNGMRWFHGSRITDAAELGLHSDGGLFMTSDRNVAGHYATDEGRIYERRINVQNPFFVENTDMTRDLEMSGEIRKLAAQGFDAIVPLDYDDIVILDRSAVDDLGAAEPSDPYGQRQDGDRRTAARGTEDRRTIEVDGKRRPIRDASGRLIGGGDFMKQIRFWKWFGDSRVVDDQGRPLVVYHSSGHDISDFRGSEDGELGEGIYLTADQNYASMIASMRADEGAQPATYPVYVSMKNPLIVRGSARRQLNVATSAEIRAAAEAKGHDGIIQIFPGEKTMRQIVAFKPEQIKSATGNRGTYDPNDPLIVNEQGAGYAPETPEVPDTMRAKLAKLIGRPVSQLRSAAHSVAMLVVPMEAGSVKARALAKEFANQNRQATAQWNAFDAVLRKNYSEQQLAAMWTAADQENDLRREGKTSTTKGLASLPPDQRETVEVLHAYGEQLWQRAKQAGLVSEDAEGVHYWTPRVAANIYADGSVDSIRGTPGEFSKDAKNLRTSASSTKQRKHETTAESEAALKAKLGDDATYVKNIRVMPMAMAQLEKAIAGRTLVNQIKAHGQMTGQDLIGDEAGPNFVTFDHPALKRWMPRMKEEDGKMVPVTDSDGNIIMESRPLFVRRDFAGPLRAVFTSSLGNEAIDKIYRGLMALKGMSMSMIMISPMTHNAVIWGKAMPSLISSMGWQNNLKNIATLGGYTYYMGHQLRQDHALVNDLIAGGLVPIGGRGMNPDAASVAEGLKPGRSLAAKALGAVLDVASPKAGDAARKGVDAVGHFWHETLLWDRIGDMQIGMATQMRNHFMDAGLDQYTATRIATHFANRYAGAIPQEALSQGAHALLNVLLFSKSFTGTNLGAMKDPIVGLPSDTRAQILEHFAALNRTLGKTDIEAMDAAGEVLKQAQAATRKKAALILAADFGAMAIITTLMQAWIKGDDGEDFLRDLKERAHALGVKLDKDNPLAFLGPTWGKAGLPLAALRHPFENLEMLSQTHDNPHGKQDRIRLGEDEHGNTYYMRLPVGKVVEEMKSYTNLSSASGMLDNKLSPLVKGAVEAKENRQFDGRSVYDKDANMVMQTGQVLGHLLKSQVPFDDFVALKNLMSGNEHKGGKVKMLGGEFDMDEAKLLGTATGLSVSKLTGGDAVAELRYAAREQQAKLSNVMPDVKDAVMRGDTDKAQKLLIDAGQTPKEAGRLILSIMAPNRVTAARMRKFLEHATPEEVERMKKTMQSK